MNREERRRRERDPLYQQALAGYNAAATAAGDLRSLAWGSMVYGCADNSTPPRPVPPNWERIVEDAPEGYWEERGGVPETVEIDGRLMFPPKPSGCGFEEVRLMCVGVELPRRSPEAKMLYPALSSYVPTPFTCGRCQKCGLPMSHISWSRDLEWWPPTEVPEGAPHFRLPTLEEARESASHGYGGAHFVPASEEWNGV